MTVPFDDLKNIKNTLLHINLNIFHGREMLLMCVLGDRLYRVPKADLLRGARVSGIEN